MERMVIMTKVERTALPLFIVAGLMFMFGLMVGLGELPDRTDAIRREVVDSIFTDSSLWINPASDTVFLRNFMLTQAVEAECRKNGRPMDSLKMQMDVIDSKTGMAVERRHIRYLKAGIWIMWPEYPKIDTAKIPQSSDIIDLPINTDSILLKGLRQDGNAESE